jgi:hypothetical protein
MSEDQNKPTVMLLPKRVMCGKHGEPFRAKWPDGYASFVIEGIQALMAWGPFAEVAGGDVNTVNRLLDACPMCCRLPRDKLFALYLKANEFQQYLVTARCDGCGVVGPGTPYRHKDCQKMKEFGHLCLDCVLDRVVVIP